MSIRKFVQKWRKQILAIFSVLLMVGWVANPGARKQFFGSTDNVVVGTLGDEKIYQSELRRAKAEWDVLRQLPLKDQPTEPLLRHLSSLGLGPLAIDQINRHPEMFLLLQKEAQRLGGGVSQDEFNGFMTNAVGDLSDIDEDKANQIRQSVHDLLLVLSGYQRASQVIKISDPLRKHSAAQELQSISLNVVDVLGADFVKNVPPPTTQQLTAQFDKYADFLPGRLDDQKNPFGFGYRYPNRVKVQWIEINRPTVRAAVEKSRDPQRWEIDARKYYLQHQDQFPSTQPTASNAISLAPNVPTTRPFDQARDDVMTRIITPEVDKKLEAIQNRIVSTMSADWMAYRQAIPAGATQPTTAPASSLGVPFTSLDYLRRLADVIEKEQGVRPNIASIADSFKTAADLKNLPIGGASLEMVSFADYATSVGEAFVPPAQKDAAEVLSNFEPSQPLRDNLDSIFFFRLTDQSPEHRPASMDEVAEQVKTDFISAAAYEQAKTAARALMDSAAKTGLKSAAGNRVMRTTGFFEANSGAQIPSYNVEPAAHERFIRQAFDILTVPTTQPSGKRLQLIELPSVAKVVVAELDDVRATLDPNDPQMASFVAHRAATDLERYFQVSWYSYDQVVNRLKYKATQEKPGA